jgi:predicted N-formylglutamate amidohydrolase
VPRHAYPAGIRYAELEIRQDLLLARHDQEAWSRRIAGALVAANT